MLALPCRSADEALSLSSPSVGHGGVRHGPGGDPCSRQDRRCHAQLRLRGPLPGDLHPAGAGSPPVGWHSPCSGGTGGPSAPPPSHTVQELHQQQRHRDGGLFLMIRG